MKGGLREDSDTAAASFDLEVELSSLVAAKVIPQVVAEKLELKLNEKHVQLTKEQLYALAERIHTLLESYPNIPVDNSTPQTEKNETNKEKHISQTSSDMSSTEMKDILERIEDMQDEIRYLREEKKSEVTEKQVTNNNDPLLQDSKTTFVTTEDISLPNQQKFPVESLSNDPLRFLPTDPKSIIVLMNWLQHLIDRCGHENLSDILDYYVDVDWITDDVKISLIDYSNGITSESQASTKSSEKKISNLPSRDHIQSFLFIQKLKGLDFDKHFVERIHGELSRLMKKVEIYEKSQ
jgi:archaellum component FlaD/FlaE